MKKLARTSKVRRAVALVTMAGALSVGVGAVVAAPASADPQNDPCATFADLIFNKLRFLPSSAAVDAVLDHPEARLCTP